MVSPMPMRNRIIAIVLILFFCLGALLVLSGQSERDACMKEHRYMLKIAAEDFAKYGYVTNVSSSADRFWLSTNVVTIAGTQYKCYPEIGGGQFGDEGTLAVTTNQVFIWLARNKPPKIIQAKYKSPLFGGF